MNVTIRCYGGVRAALEVRSIELGLPEGASVGALLDRLGERHPSFARLLHDDRSVVVMRGRAHLDRDMTLDDGDVVSLSTSPMRD